MKTKKERLCLNQDTLRLAFRLFIGVTVSILIATLLGVKFAASTGIIALLGIETTNRDTLMTAARRLISFGYTVLIALLADRLFGIGAGPFAFTAFVVIMLSMLLGWRSTISINIVIAVHLFIQQQPFTGALLLNETKRILIGMIVAFAVNRWLPNREQDFLQERSQLEEELKHLFELFADRLEGLSCTESGDALLDSLSDHIKLGSRHAIVYANNNLASHAGYYMDYMNLRETEYALLREIWQDLQKFRMPSAVSRQLAACMRGLASSVHIEHPLDTCLENLQQVKQALEQSPLPKSTEEFLDLTILLSVYTQLQEITDEKQKFVAGLTEKQQQRYWRDSHPE
ncbi:MAG: aromatic acid exporter family protein [Oscillospiraceae bacterium]|jgi:uncharacterized membrane protein YgaE (UPF0421/DUF939 family)|nr:aromatic acid exporter family protein [Oscillospiraceae bacterium]MDD3260892.1 aromatic acid exporter family protein [Oscillospiraceae bacterium]